MAKSLRIEVADRFSQTFSRRIITLVAALLVMIVVLSQLSDVFLTQKNLFNILRQISLIVLLAIGETLVIVAGGFDLSVGSIVGMTGVLMVVVNNETNSTALALVVAIVSGSLIGVFNGLLITKLKIHSFIVTLGMLSIVKGLVIAGTKATPITFQNRAIETLGQGYWGLIPIPVFIMIVFVIIFHIIFNQTVFGNHLKAIGGNEEASRISGINVEKLRLITFIISGFLAACAGIIIAARIATGHPDAGQGWELEAIAAAVVGGTSLSGGAGSIVGALLGAAVIGVLSNGMILLGVSSYFQPVITGMLLILVVALDSIKKS
jgi:ribose transport system permease protein